MKILRYLLILAAAVALLGGCNSSNLAGSVACDLGTSTCSSSKSNSSALNSPTDVSISASAGSITLKWDAVNGATGYNVYRSTVSGFSADATSKLTKEAQAATSYTDSGLTDGTAYFYVVTALNAAMESGASSQVGGTPHVDSTATIPSNVSASGGNGAITVTWDSVAGATSYNLYYSTVSKAGLSGTQVAGVQSPYTLSGVANGATYYLGMTSVGSGGESVESSEISVIPAIPVSGFKLSSVTVTNTAKGATSARRLSDVIPVITAADPVSRSQLVYVYFTLTNLSVDPTPFELDVGIDTICGPGFASGTVSWFTRQQGTLAGSEVYSGFVGTNCPSGIPGSRKMWAIVVPQNTINDVVSAGIDPSDPSIANQLQQENVVMFTMTE